MSTQAALLRRVCSTLECGLLLIDSLVQALEGTNIPVASVATGFPAGQTPLSTRLEEIRLAVSAYVCPPAFLCPYK